MSLTSSIPHPQPTGQTQEGSRTLSRPAHGKPIRSSLRQPTTFRDGSGRRQSDYSVSSYAVPNIPQPRRYDTPSRVTPSLPAHTEPPSAPSEETNQLLVTKPAAHPLSRSSHIPGPEDYIKFYWKTNDLLSELQHFQHALRTVGGCGPGIQATSAMHRSFEQLLWLFGRNTYALFPRPQDTRFSRFQTSGDSYLYNISPTFESIVDALKLMERLFEDYQSYYYENSTMYLFTCLQRRFKSEASKTTFQTGSYATPSTVELKRRTQMLLNSFLSKAVEALRKDLKKYCQKGVPVIISSQESKSTRYLILTTIATFISAVTAIFLPISAEQPDGVLNASVNTFLFASLTSSIASAIHSLLALTWLKSSVRAPQLCLPFWASTFLSNGPVASLVTSAALFAAGLCLFVFASNQHIATAVVTVSFGGLYSVSLLSLGVWLVVEKWRSRKVSGSSDKTSNNLRSTTAPELLALWPQQVGPALSGSKYPSQLHQRRVRNAPSLKSIPAVWDEMNHRFLQGTHPNSVKAHSTRTTEADVEPTYSSGLVGRDMYPSHDQRYNGGTAPHIVSSNIPPARMGPALGSSFPATEDAEDTKYLGDEYDGSEDGQTLAPLDSQTYETALFLPTDEVTGEFEDYVIPPGTYVIRGTEPLMVPTGQMGYNPIYHSNHQFQHECDTAEPTIVPGEHSFPLNPQHTLVSEWRSGLARVPSPENEPNPNSDHSTRRHSASPKPKTTRIRFAEEPPQVFQLDGPLSWTDQSSYAEGSGSVVSTNSLKSPAPVPETHDVKTDVPSWGSDNQPPYSRPSTPHDAPSPASGQELVNSHSGAAQDAPGSPISPTQTT